MQQDLQSQVQRLKENGCTKIYKEKKSGKQAKNRTELQALLNVVSANDTIIVTKIDRLARSITDLQATIQVINAKGATITFLDNALTFRPNQDDPMAMLMLNMLGSFAEFERSMIASRTQEGKQYARENNKNYKEGRPERILKNSTTAKIALIRLAKGMSTSKVSKSLGDAKGSSVPNIMRIKKQYREEYQVQAITLENLLENGVVTQEEIEMY
ncbi:recombinase family protein [Enterococcus cecorum]|nr:recombinase family protein [Enterococcus cecorum]MCJ0563295.1 recombinase family protein [Enterococcus cecorum]